MGELYLRRSQGVGNTGEDRPDFYHTEAGFKQPMRKAPQLPELPKPPLSGPDPAPDRLKLRPLAVFSIG